MIEPKPMSIEDIRQDFASLDSPELVGTPTAPTAPANSNNTQIANTSFVRTAIANLIDSAPTTLDTLKEISTALGNDPNFATTITNQLGQKVDIGSSEYLKGLSVNGRTITYTKGDGSSGTIVTQDTVYTHPTTSGNKHIPSGGSAGQFLKWSANGTAVWAADNNTITTIATATGSGNAITSLSASNGVITPTLGKTFSESTHNHNSAYTALAKSKGSAINPIFTNSSGVITACNAPKSGAWFNAIPQINSSGVTELGKYLDFHISNTATNDYDVRLTATSGVLTCSGTLSATKVTGAYYADYAEWFPKGEETEPGDVIVLDLDSDKEQYIKSTSTNNKVVGVHSDFYSHIIGGDMVSEEENNKKYIPVALCGRIKTKIIGPVHKGDYVVPSHIPGVAKVYLEGTDDPLSIFGMLVEEDSLCLEIRRLKVKLK